MVSKIVFTIVKNISATPYRASNALPCSTSWILNPPLVVALLDIGLKLLFIDGYSWVHEMYLNIDCLACESYLILDWCSRMCLVTEILATISWEKPFCQGLLDRHQAILSFLLLKITLTYARLWVENAI
jgi:hypothetical protein